MPSPLRFRPAVAPLTALSLVSCSLELNLERDLAAFCSQDCFKASWTEHKKVHKPSATHGWHYCTRHGQGRSLNMPDFKWTGDLRPARIAPMRPVRLEPVAQSDRTSVLADSFLRHLSCQPATHNCRSQATYPSQTTT